MPVPALLFLICLILAGIGIFLGGPLGEAGALLAGVAAISAAVLLALSRRASREWVLVDGSNVLFWGKGTPSLANVRQVIDALEAEGLVPILWFDANVGYKVGTRYMDEEDLARYLGVRASRVRVAPSGTPADPLILREATRRGVRVVSNDRFRDWDEAFPDVLSGGGLIPGRLGQSGVTLKL